MSADFWKWLQEYLKALFGAESVEIIDRGNSITIRFILPFPDMFPPTAKPVESTEADVTREGNLFKVYADMPGVQRIYLDYNEINRSLIVVGEAEDKFYVATADVPPGFNVRKVEKKHGVVKVLLEYEG